MIEIIKEVKCTYKDNNWDMPIDVSKIKNGSKFIVGGKLSTITLTLHQHFNWFQKLMWKLCFGVTIEDYSEE